MKSLILLLCLFIVSGYAQQHVVEEDGYGACCEPINGTCGECSEALCGISGNIFQGNNTVCTNDTCTDGACCFPNDECGICTKEVCELADGIWNGYGSNCDNLTCESTTSSSSTTSPTETEETFTEETFPDGACCFNDDDCIETTADICVAELLGVFFGEGVTCSDELCGVDDDDDDDDDNRTLGFTFLGIIATILVCLFIFALLPRGRETTYELVAVDSNTVRY